MGSQDEGSTIVAKDPAIYASALVLQEAERLIHGDRRTDYGGVEESFKTVANGWALIIGSPVTSTQVALCMVWLKVMREVSHDKRDNWVDMAGYAGLGAQLNQ